MLSASIRDTLKVFTIILNVRGVFSIRTFVFKVPAVTCLRLNSELKVNFFVNVCYILSF